MAIRLRHWVARRYGTRLVKWLYGPATAGTKEYEVTGRRFKEPTGWEVTG